MTAGPRGRIGRWLPGAILIVAALILLFSVMSAHRKQAALVRADPEQILTDPALLQTAVDRGKPVFQQYCASCHGPAGKGEQETGVPDLTDTDYLYGSGKVAEIEDIVRYGIRARNSRGWNLAVMPAYASKVPDKAEPLPPQTPAQIEELTQYLLSFTGRAADNAVAMRGKAAYGKAGCWDCHGWDAGGDASIGAPSLTDDVSLYGGSHDAIYRTIARGRAGMSPAFAKVLTPEQTRSVAAYVASLAPSHPEMP